MHNLSPDQFSKVLTGGLFGSQGKGSEYVKGEGGKWTRRSKEGGETTFDKTVFVHSDYAEGLTLKNGVPHYLPEDSDVHVPVPKEGMSSEPFEPKPLMYPKILSYNVETNPANPAQWRPKDVNISSGVSHRE